jgi:Leucine-rich repeat (LRR) protein
LAYNNLSFGSISSLMDLTRLKVLDLTGNSLTQLPNDLHKFINLEELILTDNNLGHKSKESGCSTLLKSLA